jgi:hypothetical protein
MRDRISRHARGQDVKRWWPMSACIDQLTRDRAMATRRSFPILRECQAERGNCAHAGDNSAPQRMLAANQVSAFDLILE